MWRAVHWSGGEIGEIGGAFGGGSLLLVDGGMVGRWRRPVVRVNFGGCARACPYYELSGFGEDMGGCEDVS